MEGTSIRGRRGGGGVEEGSLLLFARDDEKLFSVIFFRNLFKSVYYLKKLGQKIHKSIDFFQRQVENH
jgi:hypothetical protein